ncbi:NAD-P-binding protein [Geopyxis carbonaria]|nr:NAD-P-binding protein [Geopyxis carbonaria]
MSTTSLPTEISQYRIDLSRLTPTDPFATLHLTTAPLPTITPGHVLIKMHAAALNHRDLLVARNDANYVPTTTGIIPLVDGAGLVVSTTSATFPAGTRVFFTTDPQWQQGTDSADCRPAASLGAGATSGALTQYLSAPESLLVRAPAHLSWAQAAALSAAHATAWNILFHGPAPLRPGDVVLTQGTGGASAAAIQVAAAAGAVVIATSSSDEKLQIARELGATHLVNYRSTPGWGQVARELTGGRGVDHVVDVAGAATLRESLHAVRQGGLVTLVGFVGGLEEVVPPGVIVQIISGAKTVRGVLSASKRMVEEMAKAVEVSGIVPYVGKVVPWESAREAYETIAAGTVVGKVVVEIAE